MATWYVDPVNGQNNTTGGRGSADNNAWLDWSYALYGNRVTAGDTVVLMPGNHNHMLASLAGFSITEVLGSAGDVTVQGGAGVIFDYAASISGNPLLHACATGPRIVWKEVEFRNTVANVNSLVRYGTNGKLVFDSCNISGLGVHLFQRASAASGVSCGAVDCVIAGMKNLTKHSFNGTFTFKGNQISNCACVQESSGADVLYFTGNTVSAMKQAALFINGDAATSGEISGNTFILDSVFTSPLTIYDDHLAQILLGNLVIGGNVIWRAGLDGLEYGTIRDRLALIAPKPSGRISSFGGVNYFVDPSSPTAAKVLAKESIADAKRALSVGGLGDSIVMDDGWLTSFDGAVGLTPYNDTFCALGGAGINTVYWQIDRCATQHNPRYIVFYCGINDFGVGVAKNSTFIADMVAIAVECVEKIQSYGITPIWAGCLPRKVSDVNNTDIATFNTDSIAAIEAIGGYCLNLYALMKASRADWATAYYDGLTDDATTNVHPSATGQAWIGQALGSQFVTLLPGWSPFDSTLPALTLSPTAPGKLRQVQEWSNVASAREIGKY